MAQSFTRKLWTCKYCDITINDDVPSKQQHLTGLRHKGNVERALKNLYRKGEEEKRGAEMAKREMVKIERLAREAHEADLKAAASAGGSVSPSAQAGPSRAKAMNDSDDKKTSKAWKPADATSAYGSLAADLARMQEEEAKQAAEQLLQEQREKDKQGVPGQWESIEAARVSATPTVIVAAEEEQSDRDKARNFRLKERTAAFDDEEEDGEDAAAIHVRKRIKAESQDARSGREEELRRRMVPHWTGMSLSIRDGVTKTEPSQTQAEAQAEAAIKEEVKAEEEVAVPLAPASTTDGTIKTEEVPTALPLPTSADSASASSAIDSTTVKAEPAESTPPPPSSTAGLFRKRKAGAGAGSKKVKIY